MFRNLFVFSIIFSMGLLICAIDENKEKFVNNISFITITNQDKTLFSQDESFETLTPEKTVDGLHRYLIGARRSSKL